VKGIAYMEAIVVPQRWDHWDKFGMRPALQGLRSEAGEQMVLRDNFFIEQILPKAILRTLSAAEACPGTLWRNAWAHESGRRGLTMRHWSPELIIEVILEAVANSTA